MRKNCRWLMPIFVNICFGVFSQISAEESEFKLGNKAYNEANYKVAVDYYESSLNNGMISSELFANLGTAYLKEGEIGKCILNLEKSLLLSPENSNAKSNLILAEEKIQNPVTHIPDFILVTMWNSLISQFSVKAWLYIHGVLLLIFLLLLSGMWLDLNLLGIDKLREWTGSLALIILVIAFSLGALFLSLERKNQIHGTNFGIIMNSESNLYNGPDDRSSEVTKLSEGSRIHILDRINNWYKVRMDDKDEGWIRESDFELIRMNPL